MVLLFSEASSKRVRNIVGLCMMGDCLAIVLYLSCNIISKEGLENVME